MDRCLGRRGRATQGRSRSAIQGPGDDRSREAGPGGRARLRPVQACDRGADRGPALSLGADAAQPDVGPPSRGPADARPVHAGPDRGGLRGDREPAARDRRAGRSDDRGDEGRNPSRRHAAEDHAPQRRRPDRRAPRRGSGKESAPGRLPEDSRHGTARSAAGVEGPGRDGVEGAGAAGVPAAPRFPRERIRPPVPRVDCDQRVAGRQAWYAYRVAQSTTTRLTPKQIHEIGLDEVKQIRAEMERVMRATGFTGDLAAFFELLRTDPRFFFTRPEDLLAGYREIAKRADPELIKLFGRLPRLPYG